MIFIVTGEINSGKTGYMQNLYREVGEGDGFICPKIIESGNHIRYDIQRLGSDKSIPFACPVDRLDEGWDESCRYGNYSFSAAAIEFAESIIKEIIDLRIEPFFIDEIGPLEIENQGGFYAIMQEIITAGLEGFVTVRKPLLDAFIQTFQSETTVFIPVTIADSGEQANLMKGNHD